MEYRKLGDICDVVSGGTPSRSKSEYWDGVIPWIKIGNIKGKYVSEADEFITEEGLAGSSAKMLSKGTILYTIFATLGEAGVLTIDACTNQAIAGITIKNDDIIDRDYLYYYLKSKKNYVNDIGRGVAQNNINMSILRGFEVPIREMFEQQTITDILDKIGKIIDLRKEELNRFDELIKARFVELFGDPVSNPKGWNMVELGELTGIGSSKRIFEKEYVSDGVPFYRTKEIVELSKGNIISTELFITEERFAEIKEQYGVPKAGDLLISAVGTIGVIWIVDGKNDFYFKDGNLIRVDGSELFDSVYMKNLLEHFISEYKKQMSSGTAYAALTISGLAKMKVYDVPMDLQKQFANFVKLVDKSKVVVQKALNEMELLYNRMMQEFFG